MSSDPVEAIVESALALTPEDAFAALHRAFAAMPRLRERAFVTNQVTADDLAALLRGPAPLDQRFAPCMMIDFAHDPDLAMPRLRRFYERHAGNQALASAEAHLMMSFAGLFKNGVTLRADLERQRGLPPAPAPPALVALEDHVLSLPEEVALDALERAMASLGDRLRIGIERYAQLLREPDLLHAALAARQGAVFRVLAMLVAYAHSPEVARPLLERVIAECKAEREPQEAHVYARPWAELLPGSRVRLITLSDVVEEMTAAGSIVNQALDWLPDLRSVEQCRAMVEAFADRTTEHALDQLVGFGVRRLPADVAFVPLLARVVGVGATHARIDAAQKLARIDHDDARRALLALLPAAVRSDALANVIIDAAVRLSLRDLAALRAVVDRMGDRALFVIAGELERTPVFRDDPPAWATFAVSYVRTLPDGAAAVLRLLPKSEVTKAAARHSPPKRHRVIGNAPRWLLRYEAGAHEEVWAEMMEAGPAAHGHEEARAVARMTMERARECLSFIARQLTKHGYPASLRTRPIAKLDATITAIEKLARVPVPLSLRAYWEIIGTIDLRPQLTHRSFDGRWAEWEQLDPLQTWEPKDTLRMLRQAPPPKAVVPSLRPLVHLALGLDAAGKVDEAVSEGPLVLVVEDAAADGRIGGGAQTFVAYLREACARGGFVALDAPQHRSWELSRERALLALPTPEDGGPPRF